MREMAVKNIALKIVPTQTVFKHLKERNINIPNRFNLKSMFYLYINQLC
jgi:hypothetical protein